MKTQRSEESKRYASSVVIVLRIGSPYRIIIKRTSILPLLNMKSKKKTKQNTNVYKTESEN